MFTVYNSTSIQSRAGAFEPRSHEETLGEQLASPSSDAFVVVSHACRFSDVSAAS